VRLGLRREQRRCPAVAGLMSLCGSDLLTAITLAFEISDFTRFARPR
jgi:hypothetical protein